MERKRIPKQPFCSCNRALKGQTRITFGKPSPKVTLLLHIRECQIIMAS